MRFGHLASGINLYMRSFVQYWSTAKPLRVLRQLESPPLEKNQTVRMSQNGRKTRELVGECLRPLAPCNSLTAVKRCSTAP